MVHALAAAGADPPDLPRGIADDDRVRRDIANDDRARADHRVPADLEAGDDDRAGRDDRGGGDHRATASAGAAYGTRAPPERSERIPASRTRTTRRPASPSLRGFLPPWTHSMKWRISTCSASVIGTRGLRMSPARYERRSSSLESDSTPKS